MFEGRGTEVGSGVVDGEEERVDAVFDVQKVKLYSDSLAISLSARLEPEREKMAYVLLTA